MTEPYRGIFAIQYSTFREDGVFDESDFESQVEFTVGAGAHGIVWPVMASEFTVLTEKERHRSTELLLKRVAGRLPVVIGVATVWTELSVELARHAEDHGADAIISLPPYVQKPTRDQARTFYQALSDAVSLPIFLQNCDGAMGLAFTADEIATFAAEIPRIDYVKEETAPMGQRISKVVAACGDLVKGVFAGGACRELPRELERGAVGNMSSAALCDVFAEIYDRHTTGDQVGAREIHRHLLTYLNLQNIYGHALVREVLRRRGVISSAYPRFGLAKKMDEHDGLELDYAWDQLQPYFRL